MRPHLLVISQVYVPDPAAVGQYMAEAAEEMDRRGWQVTVYAASRGYDDPRATYPLREVRGGTTIQRLPFSSFGKSSIAVRLVAQSLFLLQACMRGLFGRRPDLILVSTSPPFAGFAGALLSRWRSAPLAWWVMDINPDQIVATGKLSGRSRLARLFDWMNRVTLRQAATVVTLDHFMADRLAHKMPGHTAPNVIPPWPLAARRGPQPDGSTFRRRHGLDDTFVVMYAGNHAIQHPLATLLEAARHFEDDRRLAFVFVGGGSGKSVVDARIAAGATNVRSLPAVPLEQLADMLAAANVHAVTMGDDMVGIVHPSKVYTAMATGRPILFFGPEQSHVGELVATNRVGWIVRHGDVTAAIAAIRAARDSSPETLANMGRRAADAMAGPLSGQALCGRFCDLMAASVVPSSPFGQR